MVKMVNNKEKLEKILKRNEELKPIVFKSFKTEKELDNYSKKIQKEINEYYDNLEKIEKLEWELMTSKEREEKEKYLRFLELKAKGAPFDPEDIL